MQNSTDIDKKLSIHHHLVGLVLIAVIPVVLFACGLVAYLAYQRSEALENNLLGTTRALNSVLDEQIVSVVSSLKILAEVEDFNPDSIQYLHKRLRRFVNNQGDWAYISFVDTQGTQIFNTATSYGNKKLPILKKDSSFRQMLNSGKTVISGYNKDHVITVSVPVKKDGMIVYALVGSLKLDSFSNLLSSQKLPDEWTAALMDKDANILAHSREAKKLVGSKAKDKLSEKVLWEGSHIFNDANQDGKNTLGAIAHSKITGWTIVLNIPDDEHLFTYWMTIASIITGGALLLTLSILLAIHVGRRIARPILALSQSAQALGEGKPMQEIETSLQEVHDVSHALKLAALERGLSEEKINTLYVKAQEAVTLRDTFLSVASHELKTPLTTLKLQFQMLERVIKMKELVPRQDLEKPFSRVQDQLRRLMLLIDDLLDVSRISAGKIEYHPEAFDFVPFLQEVIQQFEGEALTAGSPITLNTKNKLVGFWDRHRLEQVMVNLITNAIKYGNGKPITINVLEGEDQCLIEVMDRGHGISPQNLEKIFERYERVGDTRSVSGLGLGLWIAQRILDGFGATITVTSKLGEGSVFQVKLPLHMQGTRDIFNYNLAFSQNGLMPIEKTLH
ncbi:MAG TPA: sensor histidine kinase [Bacteriovoracaceae bacterium]|nr:sensor histidine kinase [Bacteriovoracaceae bacterium]